MISGKYLLSMVIDFGAQSSNGSRSLLSELASRPAFSSKIVLHSGGPSETVLVIVPVPSGNQAEQAVKSEVRHHLSFGSSKRGQV